MDKQKKDLPIPILVGLMAVLLLAVVGVFAMLERMAPSGWEENTSVWNAILSRDGGPTAYSMRHLGKKERGSADVQKWLSAAGDYIAQELDGEDDDQVFWLYRQDSDEYVLYMPEQERMLKASNVTANEEKDEDGNVTLILRVRTPEDGEETEAKGQLLAFRTDSVKWNGIRVKVILDGREQEIYTLTSKGEDLFSPEETYIGRN